jgi:hypothetical protein
MKQQCRAVSPYNVYRRMKSEITILTCRGI